MRTLCGLMLGGLVAVLLCGCGPALSEEELGTAVFEVPEIPGAEEPYELPDSPAAAASPVATTPSDPDFDLPIPP